MIRKIAIVGATGMLGKPVATALSEAGFEVAALVRNKTKAQKMLPTSVKLIQGDLKDETSLKEFLYGQDAVHLNLSIKQNERATDWHSESNGIKKFLPTAKEAGIKRISYLSALIIRYQGMNGFDWWAFKVKKEAIELIKHSGIPYTVFYPSTFMEALTSQYKQGPFMFLAGKSKCKQYFIAAKDYARQVVRSYQILNTENRDYVIQGPEGLTNDEAVAEFTKHFKKGKLFTLKTPPGLIRFYGMFIQKMNYGYHILEALNNYPEKFEAGETWKELGTPYTNVREFASRH